MAKRTFVYRGPDESLVFAYGRAHIEMSRDVPTELPVSIAQKVEGRPDVVELSDGK